MKLTDLIRPILLGRALTGLTGGGITKLDGIVTVGLALGTYVEFISGSALVVYRLRAGTDAEISPGIIRPDDYAATTNEKVWEAISVSILPITISGGKVGIGTTSPLTMLHVVDTLTTSPRGILSAQVSTGTDGARVGFSKARGTPGAETTVVTGDTLGRLMFRGYDGANYLEMGSIEVGVSGTVAATRVPTFLAFSTATDAVPSVLTERMRIDNVGNVGIGTTAPAATLDLVRTQLPNEIFGTLYHSSAGSSFGFIFARARGTATVPGGLVSGDEMGSFYARGHDGTSFGNNVAAIIFNAAQTFTTSAHGTSMSFLTALNGTSSRQLRMFIDHTGFVGFGGNFTPGATIDVTGFIQWSGQKRVATQFDMTTTTLTAVTGLSVTLTAGKTYHFRALLDIAATTVGGSKFAIAGTATATSIFYWIRLTDGSTNAHTINSRQSALAGSAGQAGTLTGQCEIEGLITVNGAGTLLVQFAQNVANGTSSILVGSIFIVEQIN